MVGQFDSHSLSPNLGSLNPNVAYELITNQAGVKLRFVAPSNDNEFQPQAATTNWADTANWSTGVIPTSYDFITVENGSGQTQQLDVEEVMILPNSKNAFTHELTILGQSESMKVTVQEGSSLSSTIGVNVGNLGALEFGGGTVVTSSVNIQSGGAVVGDGTVVGNMVVAGGVLQPGTGVGNFKIDGNYTQSANGTIRIDIEDAANNEVDTVNVSKSAQLDGTLSIDASLMSNFTPGDSFEIIAAGSLSGRFDEVTWSGNNDVYFLADYDHGQGIVRLFSQERGDMNGDSVIDQLDVDLFVFILMSGSELRFLQKAIELCDANERECLLPSSQAAGDWSGSGGVDFDDIPYFQDVAVGSGLGVGALEAAVARYLSQPTTVPEPSTALSLIAAISVFGNVRARRPSAAR